MSTREISVNVHYFHKSPQHLFCNSHQNSQWFTVHIFVNPLVFSKCLPVMNFDTNGTPYLHGVCTRVVQPTPLVPAANIQCHIIWAKRPLPCKRPCTRFQGACMCAYHYWSRGVVCCSFHRSSNMELKVAAANEASFFQECLDSMLVIGKKISEIILHCGETENKPR